MLAQRYGWRGVSVTVTLVVAAAVPLVMLLTAGIAGRCRPRAVRNRDGARAPAAAPRQPVCCRCQGLDHGPRDSMDFWLLTGSFAVCGLSTNGLINTHLIAYCADHGISEIARRQRFGRTRRL